MFLTWWITLCLVAISHLEIIASAPPNQDSKTANGHVEPFGVNTSLLRGAINARQRGERRIATEELRQNEQVTVFLLFLFGSQNAAFTSWNVSEKTFSETTLDDDSMSPTVLYSAAMGTYSSTTTDTTELIRLLPGHYYQFNISDVSVRDGAGIDYTWVLSEPAFPLASGQVLSGRTQSSIIYVPTELEAMANMTMPSSAPSSSPTIDCVIRGGTCVTGSDCCSNRCSPDLICYPQGTEHGDRDKLTQGEGGAGGGSRK
jgi:hypothetical protein